MTIQSQSQRVSSFLIANAAYGVYTPPVIGAAILEVIVVQAAAAAMSVGLGRPVTAGTPTGAMVFQQDDLADPPSVTNGHISWLVQPTAPAVFHRRWNSAAVIGMGIVWTFRRGLNIAGGSSMVLWNITATQAMDVNVVIDS